MRLHWKRRRRVERDRPAPLISGAVRDERHRRWVLPNGRVINDADIEAGRAARPR